MASQNRNKVSSAGARMRRPRRFDRNLVIIGAGSAGLVGALVATAVRARTTLVEEGAMGGDCLNTGCVPSKTLIHAARAAAIARSARAFGVHTGMLEVDFPALMAHVRGTVARVAPHDSVERYRALGVDVRHGHARLLTPWAVDIDGTVLTSRAILIATGADPLVPPIPGLDGSGYLTSDTIWSLESQPRNLLVLGGGPLGCEFAQAFARLGTQVTQVEMAERVLVREDHEVGDFVAGRLRADGVDLRLGYQALRVDTGPEGRSLACRHRDREVALPFDAMLVAVGRKPRTQGLGLEELGLAAPDTVETNAYLQTLHPSIYACGDVAGPYQYTHAAAHQARHATINALFGRLHRTRVDYAALPAVTFVDPEVGHIGLNENEARAEGIEYEVTRYDLSGLDRALTEDAARGFVKVLTVPGKDRILGATIVGTHAGELLAELAVAMHCKVGLATLLDVIHAYPTWSEANRFVAGAWKRAHAPEGVLRWLERYHDWRRRGAVLPAFIRSRRRPR